MKAWVFLLSILMVGSVLAQNPEPPWYEKWDQEIKESGIINFIKNHFILFFGLIVIFGFLVITLFAVGILLLYNIWEALR